MVAMVARSGAWSNNVYTNIQPTYYGTGETLLAQSAEHLRTRPAFTGCNAGQHVLPLRPARAVSICKIGRGMTRST